MPVTNVLKDADNLTMTVEAVFDASIESVWEMWENPRLLERWWGPPSYPATMGTHELVAGGSVTYYMTGPEGDRHHGWWRIVAVDPPRRLELEDGFADENGAPNADLPTTRMQAELVEKEGGGTVMTIASKFSSAEAMEQLIEMGMEEGITLAINQIDDLL